VKQNVFSKRILGVGDGKKNKKQKQKQKRVRNKTKTKSSGPKHGDVDAATSPPSCGSAGFRQGGPSEINGQMETCRFRNEGSDFFKAIAIEKCFGGVFSSFSERDDC